MKKFVVVLNTDGKMHAKARDSMEHAADRWGASLIVLNRLPDPSKHVFWNKLIAWRSLPTECRVLQLDSDMIVRIDAPSPFDLVPFGHFGAVRECLPFAHIEYADESQKVKQIHLKNWESVGLKPLPDPFWAHYLNAGFYLYELPLHSDLLETTFRLGERNNWQAMRWLGEQCGLSMLLHEREEKVCWLPWLFNAVAHGKMQSIHRFGGPMSAYIQHYIGKTKHLLKNAAWRIPEPHRSTPFIEMLKGRDIVIGAEVGVYVGDSALRWLSSLTNLHLSGIDPYFWKLAPGMFSSEGGANLAMNFVNEQARGFGKRFQLFREYSPQAFESFADESLDFVFVDGMHTLDACTKDILGAIPKLAENAIIGGHDYGHPDFPGVKQAVDKIFGSKVETGEDYSWWRTT